MNPTSSFWLDSFYETLVAERNASPNTLEAYRKDLEEFQLFAPQGFEHISPHDIMRFREHLLQQQRAPSTIARKIVAVRQFFKFCVQEGFLKTNPTQNISLPKYSRPLPKVISQDMALHLLEAVAQGTDPEDYRLWVLLELLYGAGLRASELVSLRLEDIHVDNTEGSLKSYIRILGKGGKERCIPLHDTCVLALQAYLRTRAYFFPKGEVSVPWVFPSSSKSGHLTRQRLGQLLKEVASKAGLDAQKLSPHVMRHAFATHLLDNGANLRVIQKLLGHADISTTQIYTHIQMQHLQDLLQKHHPLAKVKTSGSYDTSLDKTSLTKANVKER